MAEDDKTLFHLMEAIDVCDKSMDELLKSAKEGKDISVGLQLGEFRDKYDQLVALILCYVDDADE